ncbi:hypothetical protein BGZ65_008844 [Modicella reniformis]|uniref:Crinkler effector protein N-terminal domain-containing protein n=1 Tax=Modicella reniformis TaxID=1440133 RepID=A0A9P6MAW3_9FUNG|nr:hypothetical protein BGZ65_008844 [Modicella reniformis]
MAFEVEIERERSVSSLRDAIKDKNVIDYKDVDAKYLILWKVPISVTDDEQTQGETPRDSISSVFPSVPDKETYVLIQEAPSSGKRKAEEYTEHDVKKKARTLGDLLFDQKLNSLDLRLRYSGIFLDRKEFFDIVTPRVIENYHNRGLMEHKSHSIFLVPVDRELAKRVQHMS